MLQNLFVLGGNDAEMLVIKALLSQAGQKFAQPNTGWGDHKYSPSDLGLEILPAENRQDRPGSPARIKDHDEVVFVEATPAGEWPNGTPVAVVDHHGERAGEPASILQVLRHLEVLGLRKAEEGLPLRETRPRQDAVTTAAAAFRISDSTRRWVEIVAANDAAYIPGMLALGATPEEVERIRALDRSAQGITPAHEAEAIRAIGQKETSGRLTVVRMAHSKCATVSDRLFGAVDQLIILSGDGEVNFFGDGALCAALKEKFEGWNGGSGLGKARANAFWGGYPSQDEVLAFIRQQLS